MNRAKSHVNSSINAVIKSRINEFSLSAKFLLVDDVADVPSERHINKKQLKIPSNICLADPEFHKPARIDSFIGAEHFYRLLCVGQIEIGPHATILQKTQFRWIISGKVALGNHKETLMCNLSMDALNNQVNRFWEIEETSAQKILSNAPPPNN